MKIFTLTFDSQLPGADFGAHFQGLELSTELLMSNACLCVPGAGAVRHKLMAASIEVWNEKRYLVPERKAGSSLLVLDFDKDATINVKGGTMVGTHLLRLGQQESCTIDVVQRQSWLPPFTPIDLAMGRSQLVRPHPVRPREHSASFYAAFTGCFLKIERDGRPLEADSVIE